MSAENFHIIDETVFGNWITKRDFSKIYHQERVILNDLGKIVDFTFVETSSSYHIVNAYLQFCLTLQKNGGRLKMIIKIWFVQ